MTIPFARPSLGADEEEAVLRVLRSGWLTTGKECLAFEEEFSSLLGVPHALAVNSATSGLHLALEALGIGPGDHVAVSPYTFTASCEIMRYLGAHPAFVDIKEGSFHLDPEALEGRIREGLKGNAPPIKAVMPVHLGGLGLFVREIYEIAGRYGLPVVEDAAHAFPARSAAYGTPGIPAGAGDPAYLGTGGTVGVYSFYANKTITTGEGGMIVCRDGDLAKRMKTMRLHGIDREAWHRFTSKADQWRYAVVAPGYKYNLSDLAACIGRVQLRRADEFMEKRRLQARRYHEAFADLPWLEPPPFSEKAESDSLGHSWHLYTVRLKAQASGGRDEVLGKLNERGIGTSVHYIPLHVMPYYRETYGLGPGDFPAALGAYETCFSLPIYPDLKEEEQDFIIEELLKIGDTFPVRP